MSRQLILVMYAAAMAAVITGVNFAFLKDQFWARLIVNIAIVLAFYVRFLRSP
jgi:hypothetical protein